MSTTRRRFLGIVAGLLAVCGAQSPSAAAKAHPAATPHRQAASLDGVASRSVPGQSAAGEAGQVAAGSPLEELLPFIPDTDEHRGEVTLTDVALAAGRIGAQPPPNDADKSTVLGYVEALFDAGIVRGPFLSGINEYAELATSRRAYFAFGVGDISQMALTANPPQQTELIFGRFDPAATDAALSACADCPPLARETHQGVPFYSWGGDFELDTTRRLMPPAYDQFGRGGRIAVQPQHVYRTLGTEGMQAAIDTSLGMRPSLADVSDYGALVAGLASLDAFSLFLTGDTSSQAARGQGGLTTPMGVPDEMVRRATDPSLLLRPYRALALGVGTDDGGSYMTIGLMHATEQLASENVEILPRRIDQAPSLSTGKPWSERFGDVEARAEQGLLLAKVRRRGGGRLSWLSWWNVRDSLLFYD